MNTIKGIKQNLFTQWHLVRWIRLLAGVFFAIQGVILRDAIAGFISALFLFQAFTNTGCCGVSGCAVPDSQRKNLDSEAVEYEEVKGRK